MGIKRISDVDKLPSVLRIEEVNDYFIQLMKVVNESPELKPLIAAEAINNLISYQGYNEEGLSKAVSLSILEWTKKIYDSKNFDLVEICSANLANLSCLEATQYLTDLINESVSESEKSELTESLREIEVR